MKKAIFTMIMAICAIMMSAQTAMQETKFFDNTYVGADMGIATPLSFDDVFPLNTTMTLRIGKQFTPIWGTEIEGTAWFGSNVTNAYNQLYRFDGRNHNAVRGIYVGLNGTANLSNLLCGYKGTPRLFELSAIVGAGWVHGFTPNVRDKYNNHLGVKTGLSLDFNLGKAKAHTVSVRSSVVWNLSQPGNSIVGHFHAGGLAFNSNGAQLQISVGYTYYFKTSNGTHHFKTYNIGDYDATINQLNEELSKKPKEVEVVRYVDRVVNNYNTTIVNGNTYILFAWDSAELDATAKAALDKVSGTVKVVAYASPEGTEKHNKELSQKRANAVANYLRTKGVTVTEANGYGVNGKSSNRVAIVTVQ